MPDEFSADELIDRILLMQKIGAGLAQVQEGKVYSEKEAEKKIFNSITIKAIEDGHNNIGVSEPIENIKSFLGSLI